MIVAMVFDLLQTNLRQLGWAYYVFADRCRRDGWRCIVEQKYLSWQLNEQDRADLTVAQGAWDFSFQQDQADIQQSVDVIPQCVFEKCHQTYGALSISYLLTKPWEPLESALNTLLDRYESEAAVEAILIYPMAPCSVRKVAEERGIPLYVLEVSPMRWPIYTGAAFFSHFDQLSTDPGECQRLYQAFKIEWKEKGLPLLTCEQILAIYLESAYLPYLRYLKIQPDSEALLIGNGTNGKSDLPHNWDRTKALAEILRGKLGENIRFRPDRRDPFGSRYGMTDEQLSQESPNIVSILRSKRVFSSGSNMMFEAMLWRRPVYSDTKDHGLYFICNHTEDWKDELAPEVFLNFFAFVYVVPMDLATKDDYVRWRLTGPSFEELYDKHLNHFLARWGLTSEQVLGTAVDESVDLIAMAKGAQGSCCPREDLPADGTAWETLRQELHYSDGPTAEKLRLQRQKEEELRAAISRLSGDKETILALQTANRELSVENAVLRGEKETLSGECQTLSKDKQELQAQNRELIADHQALRENIRTLQKENHALSSENHTLSVVNQTLREEKQGLDEARQALDVRNRELSASLELLGKQRCVLENENLALKDSAQVLLAERDASVQSCEELSAELKGFLHSHSWRMTAPLRWCRSFLRRLFGGPKG